MKFFVSFAKDTISFLQLDFFYSGKQYLFLLLGAIIFYFGLNMLLAGYIKTEFEINTVMKLGLLGAIYLASTSFFHYKSKLSAVILLQIPVSNFTKYLTNLLWGAAIYPACLFLMAILCQSILYSIYNGNFSFAKLDLDLYRLCTHYLLYLLIFSIYYLGGIFFKKSAFLKTSLILILGFGIAAQKLFQVLLEYSNTRRIFEFSNIMTLIIEQGDKIKYTIFTSQIALILLMLFAAYYSFKKAEVK